MIRYLASLVCRWKGHRWGKPVEWHLDSSEMFRIGAAVKYCRRCGLVREVRRRQPKVATVAEQLTGALARNFGQNKDVP